MKLHQALMVLGTFITIIASVSFYNSRSNGINFRDTIDTQATVLKKTEHGPNKYVDVSFQAGRKKIKLKNQTMPAKQWHRTQVGQPIPLRYDPRSPKIAAIGHKPSGLGTLFFLGLLFCLGPGQIVLGGIVYLEKRRQQRLDANADSQEQWNL